MFKEAGIITSSKFTATVIASWLLLMQVSETHSEQLLYD